jgi:excisionase family DNA binding protein
VSCKRRQKSITPAAEAQAATSNNLTVSAAAEMLGVSSKLVYKMFATGKLQGHRVESRVVIYRESVQAVIDAGRNGTARTTTEGQQPGPEPARKRRRPAARGPAAPVVTGFRFLP